MVDGTLHRVIGLKKDGVESSGVVNKDNLIGEIEGLMRDAFKVALEGMYIAPRRESETSEGTTFDEEMNDNETRETSEIKDVDGGEEGSIESNKSSENPEDGENIREDTAVGSDEKKDTV